MTYILGVNAFHADSSACLVHDGIVVNAAEEERFRRVKHWAGLPSDSIRFCLSQAGITLNDIDAIAINQDSRANFGKKVNFLLRNTRLRYAYEKLRLRRTRHDLAELINREISPGCFDGDLIPVEHHRAHLSSSYHVSQFSQAVVVSVDGFGDFSSGAWGVGEGAQIEIEGRVHFPHSLGCFYQALTQYLGFSRYGDEYKVMGLAPYGQPAMLDQMRDIVGLKADGGYELNLDYFIHHKENVASHWENGTPVFGRLYSGRLEELLGPARGMGEELDARHIDIASSVQAMYEEAFFHLLNTLYSRHSLENLALAGGCAMNSASNGKIRRLTSFNNVYVQPAPGDAGGAVGAALCAWHEKVGDSNETFGLSNAYLGPEYTNGEIEIVIDESADRFVEYGVAINNISSETMLLKRTARAIADGKVIGWFQGRMEWGPRALGNRSILGDPRRADMKDILNSRIKRREEFRPFAPAILREAVSEWFEEDADVPYMTEIFLIRTEKRHLIPSVTHVDGSGRLQTVTRDANPRFHGLISEFSSLSGVPILLNTSFNENEPIVCTPQEAVACFLRTNMDVLVLGDWFLERGSTAN